MYEMFAFELPWQRGSDGMAAMSHGQSEPPPLTKYYPSIDPTLMKAIAACIRPDPLQRTQSMNQFLNSIRMVKQDDTEDGKGGPLLSVPN